MKPSREVSVGLIRTLLSRPPRISDMLEAALKDLDVGIESVSQQYGFRILFTNLRDVKSYEELDKQVLAVLRNEVCEVVKALPENYVDFVKTFFKLMDIEILCLETPPSRVISMSLGSIAESKSSDFEGVVAHMHDVCVERGIDSVYVEYLNRVLKSLTTVDEDYRWVYEAVKSLVALHYYRYLKNSELLRLEIKNFENFLKILDLDPLTEITLKKSLEALSRVDVAELSKYTVYEASEALDIATKLTYFREGLINILTFYLISKYYETKVTRYVFLPKVLKRW
ncbi:MAG: hypothetical protein RMI56_01110 [Sulfolobales archaeon]|nr:hypothetical protein [Sulfolobales archaeon]MDW8082379.1 hypothetical protein [Sulfolobales archaeon]